MRRVAVVFAALALVVPATPAEAAPATVTWTVQPATAAGPDGRRWVERTLDPGTVVTEHLAVRNFSETPASFTLTAADGYLTGKGRFNMLPSDQESVGAGTWIAVRESVTVAAGSTAVVPFTITVPANATPGDHPAGIAASVAGRQGSVRVESRVGFRVLLRAAGEVAPGLTLSDVSAVHERSWNPFTPGAVTVTYQVANTGNVRLDVEEKVRSSSLLGLASASSGVVASELLPDGHRTVSARVDGVWGLGPVTTTVDLTSAAPATATVTTWTVPWPQLLLVAAVAALLAGSRALRRHRRQRLRDLLAQARLEGALSGTRLPPA
ncbi:hypothetical protein FB565_003337 [Actinoplanes lutulentus]|uniref:DUF916 domain-containing protein n=1 Tax=Actinoplanes lutulentus TaxID=1287878 RepID=A0A327Z4K8_9ACTN|nr:hypothetical protein [Actinoplanes lutulentus]MBB2943608.1 hypothetical protein [Actinoplanes lutulentus]RAK27473.1 hypothetical protein B0I29_123107 [Actinoplanes lutulentus]